MPAASKAGAKASAKAVAVKAAAPDLSDPRTWPVESGAPRADARDEAVAAEPARDASVAPEPAAPDAASAARDGPAAADAHPGVPVAIVPAIGAVAYGPPALTPVKAERSDGPRELGVDAGTLSRINQGGRSNVSGLTRKDQKCFASWAKRAGASELLNKQYGS